MIENIGNIISWINMHGGDLVRIFILTIIYYLIFRIIIWRIIKILVNKKIVGKDGDLVKKRAITLRDVFLKTGQFIFLIGVIVAVLQELGVNVAPLLAGFGIIGIAVGFGTQSLIKDVVNGIFIIIEGQYSKGDNIELLEGKVKGRVEDLTLRRTILRSLNGTVHHIPNSLIGSVSNKSQDWADIDLNIKVATDEKLSTVIDLLNNVSKDLYKDPVYSTFMLDEPEVLGVESIEDAKVTIRIAGRTKHSNKKEVQRELRKRIKETFEKEKIKLV